MGVLTTTLMIVGGLVTFTSYKSGRKVFCADASPEERKTEDKKIPIQLLCVGKSRDSFKPVPSKATNPAKNKQRSELEIFVGFLPDEEQPDEEQIKYKPKVLKEATQFFANPKKGDLKAPEYKKIWADLWEKRFNEITNNEPEIFGLFKLCQQMKQTSEIPQEYTRDIETIFSVGNPSSEQIFQSMQSLSKAFNNKDSELRKSIETLVFNSIDDLAEIGLTVRPDSNLLSYQNLKRATNYLKSKKAKNAQMKNDTEENDTTINESQYEEFENAKGKIINYLNKNISDTNQQESPQTVNVSYSEEERVSEKEPTAVLEKAIETMLSHLGYTVEPTSKIDKLIRPFQKRNSLPITGDLNPETLHTLVMKQYPEQGLREENYGVSAINPKDIGSIVESVNGGSNVKPGTATHEQAKELTNVLIREGYLDPISSGSNAGLSEEGKTGRMKLKSALKSLQGALGVTPDGVIGPQTLKAWLEDKPQA